MTSKNHFIFACEKNEKTSQYKGVTWNSQKGKWHVLIKQKFGGSFNDELDAAKNVNKFCEELGIPLQNPEISTIPNEQFQVTKKCFFVL